jgi:predicted Zn-ribbon and HTH transcriptional regulator
MGALVACHNCYFVTRRNSAIGVAGKCPHCDRALEPVTFPAARRMLLAKREGLRSQPR